MKKPFEFSVFIGRFQPFHLAHYELVKEALSQAETAIIVIGSYKRAPAPSLPWSGDEREQMIRLSLTPEENARVKILFVRDYLYNYPMWLADVSQQVGEIIEDSGSVVLIGHEHDHTSGYVHDFPQWKKRLLPNIDRLPHATDIRYKYFTYDVGYKQHVHPKTAEYMESFKLTLKFKGLKAYFDAVKNGKGEWEGAPYEPIFHTVDAVVLKSAHILCVRRGKAYGGGQIALPGGFLDAREFCRTGALRELKEETAIDLDKKYLDKCIKSQHTFDHPSRSERGRTITEAFFLDLGGGPLHKVKGSDDADRAWWMPLNEFYSREEEFFEDHFHIINYFVGSPFMRTAD